MRIFTALLSFGLLFLPAQSLLAQSDYKAEEKELDTFIEKGMKD